MIFTFDNTDSVLFSVTKDYFHLNDSQVYQEIQSEFMAMVTRLTQKEINYFNLKKSLIPNTDPKHHELCLVFNSILIDDCCYGIAIFKELLPLLSKTGTYSILEGDYINITKDYTKNEGLLKEWFDNEIKVQNPAQYLQSNQFFVVYINNINQSEIDTIISGLQGFKPFYGYAFLDFNSPFKSCLARILLSCCIKYKDTIIASHPEDYSDDNNINMLGYPFLENGFRFISINQISFIHFLKYKIESTVLDPDDIGFSFNALFPKFTSMDKLKVIISDEKYDYLTSNKTGKDGILKKFGFGKDTKDQFFTEMCDKIRKNYIYCLDFDELHNVYKFNICAEFDQIDGKKRKAIIPFKYSVDTGEVFLLTFY